MTARFDIFNGTMDSAMWIEVADSLEAAKERMTSIARKSPARYFVFDQRTHEVMYSMDTTPSVNRMESPLMTSQTV
jgi:hypothetical protein